MDIFVDENIDDIQPIEEIKEDDENWVKSSFYIIIIISNINN